MKNVAAGTVLGGSLLFAAGLGIATAQPDTAPDGLVNVTIGNAGVLENVKAADAAQIAAGVCDIDVAQVTTLADGKVARVPFLVLSKRQIRLAYPVEQ